MADDWGDEPSSGAVDTWGSTTAVSGSNSTATTGHRANWDDGPSKGARESWNNGGAGTGWNNNRDSNRDSNRSFSSNKNNSFESKPFDSGSGGGGGGGSGTVQELGSGPRKHVSVPAHLEISGLPADVNLTDIRQIFGKFGKLSRVVLDHRFDEERGFCFVEYERSKSAEMALKLENGRKWLGNGKPITVTIGSSTSNSSGGSDSFSSGRGRGRGGGGGWGSSSGTESSWSSNGGGGGTSSWGGRGGRGRGRGRGSDRPRPYDRPSSGGDGGGSTWASNTDDDWGTSTTSSASNTKTEAVDWGASSNVPKQEPAASSTADDDGW